MIAATPPGPVEKQAHRPRVPMAGTFAKLITTLPNASRLTNRKTAMVDLMKTNGKVLPMTPPKTAMTRRPLIGLSLRHSPWHRGTPPEVH